MADKPYRIAYVGYTGQLGGAERLLLRLMEGLPRDSVEPLLICAEEGPFPQAAREQGIPTSVVSLPRLHSVSWVLRQRKILNPLAVTWNGVVVMVAAWRLRRHLRHKAVDLIQTNSDVAHVYGGLATRLLRVPCVWYFHTTVESKRLLGLTAWVWRALAARLGVWVVGISQAVLDSLSIGKRTRLIYAGQPALDDSGVTDGDLRAQLGLPEDAPLVGYIGRIDYSKGVDVLVRAAQRVVRQEAGVHFVVSGETMFDPGYYKQLVHMVERLQLDDNWHWLEPVEQAAPTLRQLSVVAAPSRREGLGLVLLEAGMAGRAVVASRIGGIPEVVLDGKTGILVTSEDADELASAILNVVSDTHRTERMGQQARRRVADVFGLRRYYAEFIDLYETVL